MSDPVGPGGGNEDRVLGAFRRLLADAALGGQAKVDALVALSQRTVWVATWPGSAESYRTLVNSSGNAALPIFTDESSLDEAARRYGWLAPDGTLPAREVGAREAFRHAIAHNLHYVVVDMGSTHSLEIERNEIEPLLSRRTRGGDSGPYAGTGRLSSELIQAVRPTPPPGSIQAQRDRATPPPGSVSTMRFTPPPGSVPAVPAARAPKPTPTEPMTMPRRDAAPPPTGGPVSATFGAPGSTRISRMPHAPSDALLDALSDVLRAYPEVEWACLCLATRGPGGGQPAVGVRVDPSFRTRINELVGALRQTSDSQGAALDVLLLDDANLMRTARAEAMIFYPWRR